MSELNLCEKWPSCGCTRTCVPCGNRPGCGCGSVCQRGKAKTGAVNKEQLLVWKALIPELSALPAAPKRAILHWTAGSSKANAVDKAHYHYIFNQPSGEVIRGAHSVAANMKGLSSRDKYAGHTGGFNSFSAGFSFAGHYFKDPASNPLTEAQVRNGLAFVALCMLTWKLPVTEATLFTHYEAWTLHKVRGTMNHQKVDITQLKFAPHLGKDEVGPWMREVVKNHMVQIREVLGE